MNITGPWQVLDPADDSTWPKLNEYVWARVNGDFPERVLFFLDDGHLCAKDEENDYIDGGELVDALDGDAGFTVEWAPLTPTVPTADDPEPNRVMLNVTGEAAAGLHELATRIGVDHGETVRRGLLLLDFYTKINPGERLAVIDESAGTINPLTIDFGLTKAAV